MKEIQRPQEKLVSSLVEDGVVQAHYIVIKKRERGDSGPPQTMSILYESQEDAGTKQHQLNYYLNRPKPWSRLRPEDEGRHKELAQVVELNPTDRYYDGDKGYIHGVDKSCSKNGFQGDGMRHKGKPPLKILFMD